MMDNATLNPTTPQLYGSPPQYSGGVVVAGSIPNLDANLRSQAR
jgi:hypothetical protein